MRFNIIRALFLVALAVTVNAQQRNLDSLTQVLEKVGVDDQRYRSMWDSVQTGFGYNSPEFIALLKTMNAHDSLNYIVVSDILDRYGWLGPAETSKEANDALFLVIQHSKLEQQLKYLPMMQAAVSRHKAMPADLALLIDRTNMYQGKLQVYGSQMNFDAGGNLHVYPIEDEAGVEKRRKEMGLIPMQEYIKHIRNDVVYHVPKQDIYKNKFVVKGSVTVSGSHTPVAGVSVYTADNKLVATTESGGFFQIVLNQKHRNTALIFRKSGYESVSMPIESITRMVIDINPWMKIE